MDLNLIRLIIFVAILNVVCYITLFNFLLNVLLYPTKVFYMMTNIKQTKIFFFMCLVYTYKTNEE